MTGPAVRVYSGERLEWIIERPFEEVMRSLHGVLRPTSRPRMMLMIALKRKAALELYLQRLAGDLGLMILGSVQHGQVLGLLGGPKRAAMFLIGNPLVALGMMQVHAEAGVYAPLRVMFTESEPGRTRMTYDRPSRLFGQWPEAVFNSTGSMLDEKLERLVRLLRGRDKEAKG
jgi:uncharacterized protein (DUF302 family)